ncbi:MAG: hypothetical protein ACOX5J_15460 [Candidatus Hydrogenedentales bacterium]|jgi:hypothetical protein
MKYVPGVVLYVFLSASLSATGATVGQRLSVVNECGHAVVTQQEDFPLAGIETFVSSLEVQGETAPDDIWSRTSNPVPPAIRENWVTLGISRVGWIPFEEPTQFLVAMRHVLAPEDFSRFESFACLLGDEIVGTVTGISWRESKGVLAGNPKQVVELKAHIKDSDGEISSVMFAIDPKSGQVYLYVNSDAFSDESVNQTYEQRIPLEEAARVAARFWPLCGLEFNPDDSTKIAFADCATGNPEMSEDLFGAKWVFEEDLFYQGYPCRRVGLKVAIAADRGVVSAFNYRPVVEPAQVKREIRRETAVEIVEQEFKGAKFYDHVLESLQKVIVIPNRGSRQENDSTTAGESKSRCCWEVPVALMVDIRAMQEVALPCWVWVDIETGDVLERLIRQEHQVCGDTHGLFGVDGSRE